jgi:L-ascorbate metabolism protein UlaG (beta-lactamase superfamily)
LRGREGVVLTDPCPPDSGYKIGKQQADVVTISRHDQPGSSYREAVNGHAVFLDAPGEYEVGGILVTGVTIRQGGGPRNVAFIVELDGIKVGHLGTPVAGIGPAALDELKGVDILLFPAGGGGSLGGAASADIMTAIDPRLAIPMGYKTAQETGDVEPLDRFLRELGSRPEPQPKWQGTKSGLPAELSVVVLEPKS